MGYNSCITVSSSKSSYSVGTVSGFNFEGLNEIVLSFLREMKMYTLTFVKHG